MKIKNTIAGFLSKVKTGASRFVSVFIMSTIMFLLLSYDIVASTDSDFIYNLSYSLGLGAFFAVLLVLIAEYKCLKKLLQLLCIIPVAICFWVVSSMGYSNDFFLMGYWGIILALVCFILYLLFTRDNSKTLIPFIVKNFFFSVSVSTILSMGVSLCLAAFDTLIFNFDYEIYVVANLFVWIVLFTNLFLAYLPKREDEIALPKIFKIIVVNVALPVYILLMLILYVYLLKIVVTGKMPVGQINWFASFASLFFVFFVFNVRQCDEKLPKIFTKLIGYFIIPVVIMQLVAIYERISAYGLTTPRIVSLILVGISIIFAVFSIFRKRLEYVILITGVVVLVFTLVPKINIIEMPKKSQLDILERYLVKNEMLSNGEIITNPDVDEKDKERIVSAYRYLKYEAAGKMPDWFENSRDKDIQEVLGFDNYYDRNMHISCHYSSGEFVDVSEYTKMYKRNLSFDREDMKINFDIEGKTYSYDAFEIAKEMYETYGTNNDNIKPVELDENTTMYIENAWFDFSNEFSKLEYFDLNTYILIK